MLGNICRLDICILLIVMLNKTQIPLMRALLVPFVSCLSGRLSLHPLVLCIHYRCTFSLMETLESFTLLPYIMSLKLLPHLAPTFFPSIFLPVSTPAVPSPPRVPQVISHNLPSPSYHPAACRRQSVRLSHFAGRASSTSSFPSLLVFFFMCPHLPVPSCPPPCVRNYYSQKSSDHLRVFILRNGRTPYFLFAPRPETCPRMWQKVGAETQFLRLTLMVRLCLDRLSEWDLFVQADEDNKVSFCCALQYWNWKPVGMVYVHV